MYVASKILKNMSSGSNIYNQISQQKSRIGKPLKFFTVESFSLLLWLRWNTCVIIIYVPLCFVQLHIARGFRTAWPKEFCIFYNAACFHCDACKRIKYFIIKTFCFTAEVLYSGSESVNIIDMNNTKQLWFFDS